MLRLIPAGIAILVVLFPSIASTQVFDIRKTLEESRTRTQPLLDLRPIERLRDKWHKAKDYLRERARLDLGVSYTFIAQQAVNLENPNDTVVGNLDMYGIWTLLDRTRIGTGALGLLVKDRRNWGALTGNDLSAHIGLPWAVNDSASEDYTRINQLWWRHEVLGDKLTFQLGRIDQSSFFGNNRVATNGNTMFMMQSFVQDQTVRFPGNGTGVNIRYEPRDWFYLTTGFGDANGDPNKPPADDLGLFANGDYFKAIEIGFSGDAAGLWSRLGRGNYRFMGWQSDGTEDNPEGAGFALSFDQEIDGNVVSFLRYGNSPDGAFRAFQALSAGVVWQKPFGRFSDRTGLAGVWAEPVGSGGRDQYAMELFYRLEVIEGLAVSPDVQLIFSPALQPQRDFVGVFGIRTRLVF